ncbi:MAG: protein kinase [Candidatus Moraniibacteriota bacterium]
MQKRFEDEFAKHPIFQDIIDRCESSTFSVARPVAYCATPMCFSHNQFIDLPGLIYDYIPGPDLSNTLKNSDKKTAHSFLTFAKGLTRVVQLIHNEGVLHSFLVPRNIIRSNNGKYIIVGFGYSSFCDSGHHSPTHKVSDTDQCYRAPECAELENLGALWFPVDIYSIGAILYQFATGSIPNGPDDPLPRDANRLKEHIYDKLSDRTGGYKNPKRLFKQNENILKILDRCLRYKPEDRFSCAEELIEALEIAEQATGKHNSKPRNRRQAATSDNIKIYKLLSDIASKPPPSKETASEAVRAVAGLPQGSRLNHLFDSLLRGWTDKAVEDAERMQRGHYEIYGHRDLLVTSLCRLLAGAQEGNIYRTMTFPSYWTNSNLGSNGRFLTMNKHMARKGLIIERIFLVNKSFHELIEREQEILEYQLEAERTVKESAKGSLKVMVKLVKDEQELADFEKNGKLVAYLESGSKPNGNKPNPQNCLCLNFVSHGKYEWLNGRKMIEHSIMKVRYWIPQNDLEKKAFEESHKDFYKQWQNAVSLEDYIGDHRTKSLDELLLKGRKFVQSETSELV